VYLPLCIRHFVSATVSTVLYIHYCICSCSSTTVYPLLCIRCCVSATVFAVLYICHCFCRCISTTAAPVCPCECAAVDLLLFICHCVVYPPLYLLLYINHCCMCRCISTAVLFRVIKYKERLNYLSYKGDCLPNYLIVESMPL